MKFSLTKLTTAAAVVALLALPVSAAQAPPSQPPAPTQPPATSGTQQPATTSQNATEQTPSAAEARQHLAKARTALDEVNAETIDAAAKAQIAEVNRRIGALERSVASGDKPGGDWASEIGRIDKILTTLIGADATTPATPSPTGTSGKAAAAELDDATRAKLREVRTHLTAFATVMVGGQVKAPTPSTDPTTDPSAAPPQSTPSTPPAATPQPTGTSGSTPPQTAGAVGQAQPPASQSGQPDEQAARQHLTSARNTLSEITQLPAAGQLTGETRTQVSQLISNFNELITAKAEWRASYAKVNANLTALIGPEIGTPDPSGAPGTAVGTSGTPAAGLDPEIRSRLIELRRQLSEFEKAAGGMTAQTPSTAANPPATDPSAPPATTPPATTPPATTPPSTTPPATQPTAPPSTTPPTSTTPSTTGTSGTPGAGSAEILRHIAAIEAMLKSEDDSGGVTLTKVQLEQLRTHLANLRQAIEKQ